MLEQIITILSKYTEASEINAESKLAADLDLSSFDLVEIVTAFEEKFDIEVPDRDLRKFVRVGDILEYIKARN